MIEIAECGSAGERDHANSVVRAARDNSRVTGLTHNFYRYPARFSPVFVRSVIEAYSQPGDWVLDPFAGGGTTLVESLALGRNAIGIDISSLAAFVSEAKTLQLNERDVASFDSWRFELPAKINLHSPSKRFDDYADAGYYRNLDGPKFWRLRKAIEQGVGSLEQIKQNGAQVLARCVVLKTAQWALDSRKKRPTVAQFRSELIAQAEIMLTGALSLRDTILELGLSENPVAYCINRPTVGAERDYLVRSACPPKLILTSPPYPGVHVLYHRWQVDGRKESPAPFWIAGKQDGAGLSYYTMGDRKNPKLRTYFENLQANFNSIAQMAGPDTTIVQMVAFSERDWQLPEYLRVMQECGLEEVIPWDADERLWRDVPNRRWHASQKTRAEGAKEVVLVHRKRP